MKNEDITGLISTYKDFKPVTINLYDAYQLDYLLTHGYSIEQYNRIADAAYHDYEDHSGEEGYEDDWDTLVNAELGWEGYETFIQSLFQNEVQMHSLIDRRPDSEELRNKYDDLMHDLGRLNLFISVYNREDIPEDINIPVDLKYVLDLAGRKGKLSFDLDVSEDGVMVTVDASEPCSLLISNDIIKKHAIRTVDDPTYNSDPVYNTTRDFMEDVIGRDLTDAGSYRSHRYLGSLLCDQIGDSLKSAEISQIFSSDGYYDQLQVERFERTAFESVGRPFPESHLDNKTEDIEL